MGPLANCLDWSGERLSYLLDSPDQIGITRRPGFRQAPSEFRQNEVPINTTWEEIGNGHFKKCFSYQSLAQSASFFLAVFTQMGGERVLPASHSHIVNDQSACLSGSQWQVGLDYS